MSQSDKKTGETKPAAKEVLFFELEYVAVSARSAVFEAVKKVLGEKKTEINSTVFSRSGLAARPGESVQMLAAALAGNVKDVESLSARAEEGVVPFFTGQAKLNKGVSALIKAALERNIQPVAVSPWPKEAASALMSRLGLEAMGVELEAFDSHDPAFPRADHWLRMIKNRKQNGIPAIAAVSSHTACKGALTAGITCIAVPDAFTSFADFSGARLFLESLDAMNADEILDQVIRH